MSSKVTLWAGPEDGREVIVETGQLQHMINVPNVPDAPTTMIDSGSDIMDRPNRLIGRYQYNSMTKRFEWMGWE